MNKITGFLLSSILLVGAAACNNVAQTDSAAPDTVNAPVTPPSTEEVRDARQDAQDQTRQAQLESDIRAQEQRRDALGNPQDPNDNAIASQVRSKLEANIPRGLLSVKSEDGVVTVAGTVPDAKELSTIEPLAKEITGVKAVLMNVKVAPATPNPQS